MHSLIFNDIFCGIQDRLKTLLNFYYARVFNKNV